MKKTDIIFVISIIAILVGFAIFSSVYKDKKNDGNSSTSIKEDEGNIPQNLLSGKYYVEMSVKKYGKIQLELDADIAPITVTNFINLVNDKFYDGLTFHRIIAGFMIQGGGYNNDGYRKTADTIKGEFKNNGVNNSILHTRGVISMARADAYNSASSEFFIMQEDDDYLDGKYAAFGHVTKGMDVVDKIATTAKPTDNNGSINLDERPVIEYIKVINK